MSTEHAYSTDDPQALAPFDPTDGGVQRGLELGAAHGYWVMYNHPATRLLAYMDVYRNNPIRKPSDLRGLADFIAEQKGFEPGSVHICAFSKFEAAESPVGATS